MTTTTTSNSLLGSCGLALATLGSVAVAGCIAPETDAPEVKTTRAAVTTANGLVFNSLGTNGISLNGISLNGISLNGISLNGISLNGISLNGISLNGISLNGISLNGISLNGISLNGISLNGISLNGISLNGISLNGISLNGISLNGSQQDDFLRLVQYMTECALPADPDACITTTDLDGQPRTYCGVAGLDPSWQDAAPDLSKSDILAGCVDDRAAAEGHTIVHEPVLLEGFKKVLVYAVECALPALSWITISNENDDPEVYSGTMGLAPWWATEALEPAPAPLDADAGERRLTACLAARVNARAQPVQLSLRGAGLAQVAPFSMEAVQYSHHEGGFMGNLFSQTPHVKVCQVEAGISGRVCTNPAGCGFDWLGKCAEQCARDASGNFVACPGGEHEVINTFLPMERRIAKGGHSCLTYPDGSMHCWGENTNGQLGDGSYDTSTTAVTDVTSLGEVRYSALSASNVTGGYEQASYAIQADGSVWSFGTNLYGRLGIGLSETALANSNVPVQVESLGNDTAQLDASADHACAVKTDGTVWCWGRCQAVSCGYDAQTNGEYGHAYSPGQVCFDQNRSNCLTGIVKVAVGERFSIALRNDGTLWFWGDRGDGGEGTGDHMGHTAFPIQAVPTLSNIVDVDTGQKTVCAVLDDGTAKCWGSCQDGMCGDGDEVVPGYPRGGTAYTPVDVLLTDIKNISVGQNEACATRSDGTAWCWGNAPCDGGNTPYGVTAYPLQAVGLSGVSYVDAAQAKKTFVLGDGRIFACGSNANNELGNPAYPGLIETPIPVTLDPCGDSVCDPGIGEDCDTCAYDCGVCSEPYCGDASCNGAEDCSLCSADCGACQGGGNCAMTFTRYEWNAGKGQLKAEGIDVDGNVVAVTNADSGALVGSATADPSKGGKWKIQKSYSQTTDVPCRLTATSECGDQIAVDVMNTPADCDGSAGGGGPVCGDNSCDAGEDCASCSADCGSCPPLCATCTVTDCDLCGSTGKGKKKSCNSCEVTNCNLCGTL